MERDAILFLHGFASSAHSSKARYLGERFAALPGVRFDALDFNPTPADFEHMTITGMIDRLRQFALDHEMHSARIIGSSLGALVALHYARRYAGVDRLLLLAPALRYGLQVSDDELRRWEREGAIRVPHHAFDAELPLGYGYHLDGLRYAQPVPPPAEITIVHGTADSIVPIQGSRSYAAAHPGMVRLVEVASDHRLEDQLDAIWGQVESFLLS
ncbi:MAG TPA: YqiA/YcfP family alpha/beta fold hydrolase [Anaerolineae bacterium]|nr:YqiA/YcfP family alpha/beta fold hydrolase [Anaerolineae bacterium]HOR00450.1 YqiA/YcfP family alpha/beta fold hydrolase [Anaerolineae bacterium]HPL27019.1 YqiA/YcfP family alpha/beta fold hydrolase [Anaerolineae bacterium]HPL27030.1 YqiA/YcfP family alpha/beta fold hydrolase [Anaerolineae bacterium]